MRTEVRLAGFGGQGIVLAGYILGKAASIFAGKDAVMTQSYGPEARGGACTSNVVIQVRENNRSESAKYAPLGTLFETAALVLLDGMVAQVMERLGESEQTMRARHAIMV